MWGKVDGTAKIDIARNSISKLLDSWNSEAKLGVMVYGHRVKGDCKDIQMLMPLNSVKKSNIMSVLHALNPKGKTPLSSSIIKAASLLKSKENAATIILVSDGLETCGMDPCAVAKKLKKENIHFKAHVIGFDLKDMGDTSKLSCIAEATGGKYYTANNSEQLNKALKVIKTVVTQKVIKVKKVVVKSTIKVKKVVTKNTVTENTIKVSVGDLGSRWTPPSCDNMRTMHITKKVSIDSVKNCVKLIVKSGGELQYDVSSGGTTVIVVETGGKSWSKNDIYALINKGGTAQVLDGDIEMIHAESGTTQISPTATFKKQSGSAEIELTTNLKSLTK